MLLSLQIFVVIACVVLCIAICILVAHRKLLLRYSLIWLALAVLAALVAIFPDPLFELSGLVGFTTPSNFIFFVALFALMILSLSLSIVVSRQARKITALVQDLALLAHRMDGMEEQKEGLEKQGDC